MMNQIMYVAAFIASILIASFSQIILKKGANEKNIYINKFFKYIIWIYFINIIFLFL